MNGESGAATNALRKEPDVSDKLKNLLTTVRLCQHFPPNGTSPCALANNPARQKSPTAARVTLMFPHLYSLIRFVF